MRWVISAGGLSTCLPLRLLLPMSGSGCRASRSFHLVKNPAASCPIFDGHSKMQEEAGLTNPRVFHSADSNKSEIVVVFDTKDTQKAKAFAAWPDLKEAMSRAGVVDTPTIYFLESID